MNEYGIRMKKSPDWIWPVGVMGNAKIVCPPGCGVELIITGWLVTVKSKEETPYDDGTTDTKKTYEFDAKSDLPPDIRIIEGEKEKTVNFKREEILYRMIFNEIRNRMDKMTDTRKKKGFIGESKVLKVMGEQLDSIEKVMGKPKKRVSKKVKSRIRQKLATPLT